MNNNLTNEDLAPIPPDQRKWGIGNYAALWVSMSLCIPTYMMASSPSRAASAASVRHRRQA